MSARLAGDPRDRVGDIVPTGVEADGGHRGSWLDHRVPGEAGGRDVGARLGVVGTEQVRDHLTVRERPGEPPGVESGGAGVLDRDGSLEVIEELRRNCVRHLTRRVRRLRCCQGCSGNGNGEPERGDTSEKEACYATPALGLRRGAFVTVHGCPPAGCALTGPMVAWPRSGDVGSWTTLDTMPNPTAAASGHRVGPYAGPGQSLSGRLYTGGSSMSAREA